MNGSEPKYSSEYVEMCTSLEHIRTRLESIDQTLRNFHLHFLELNKQVDKNTTDIAGMKATATLLGGLAGSVIAFFSKFFFVSRM